LEYFVLRSLRIDVNQKSFMKEEGRGRERGSWFRTDNEDLKTLGSGLKTARESKGLSLKDVNEKTRISVSILDAIENDRFHLLPPGVYTRNFIRTYADFLGVDSQELLDHFTKEREQTAPPVLQKDDADISAVNHRRFGRSLP
jgi:cytoskeletal protein RodZ